VSRASATASSPSRASAQTSNPARSSRVRRSSLMIVSSSAMRTLTRESLRRDLRGEALSEHVRIPVGVVEHAELDHALDLVRVAVEAHILRLEGFRGRAVVTTPEVGVVLPGLTSSVWPRPIVTCFVAVDISHQPCCSSLYTSSRPSTSPYHSIAFSMSETPTERVRFSLYSKGVFVATGATWVSWLTASSSRFLALSCPVFIL